MKTLWIFVFFEVQRRGATEREREREAKEFGLFGGVDLILLGRD